MKAAVYCRLSDEDRDKRHTEEDSESIQNQKNMLTQFVIQQGWDLYRIYSDDDYTGADRNRPDFNNLLADAEARLFQVVVCKTQSRFTREMEYVEKYLHTLFPVWGIRFISLVDHADTAVKGNKKARQINGLINEWYLEDLSENIKSVLTSRRQNGYHIGAFPLYGYRKDPANKGHLLIDEEAANIVREVFSLFLQGYGKTNISRILNERHIPNPTQYKREKGYNYKPAKSKIATMWKYSSVSSILTNEMYVGNMVQGRFASASYKTQQNRLQSKENWIRVENTHEPIIDMETWNIVQGLISSKPKPFTTGSLGLFARKVKCMNCGYVMSSQKSSGHHYLRCSSQYAAKGSCDGAFISYRRLEKAICAELTKLTDKYLDKDEAERSILSIDIDYLNRKNLLIADIDALKKRKDEGEKVLRSLYIDKTNGTINEDEFLMMMQGFRKDNARLISMITDTKARLDDIENKIKSADTRHQLIESYTNMDHLTREIVEELIEHVYVGRKDPITKEIPIEIHWNF